RVGAFWPHAIPAIARKTKIRIRNSLQWAGWRSTGHDAVKRCLELFHLLLSADRHADFGGPHWPHAPDHDLVIGHRAAKLLTGSSDFHHEEVRLARDVLDAFLLEKLERVFAHAAKLRAAFGDERLHPEARRGARETGHRQKSAAVRTQTREQIGPSH